MSGPTLIFAFIYCNFCISILSQEKIPVFFNQLPGGTALRVYGFLARQIFDRFGKHDYGWRNYDIYGTKTPPDYNVTKIRVPSHIIYGAFDWATTKAVSN